MTEDPERLRTEPHTTAIGALDRALPAGLVAGAATGIPAVLVGSATSTALRAAGVAGLLLAAAVVLWRVRAVGRTRFLLDHDPVAVVADRSGGDDEDRPVPSDVRIAGENTCRVDVEQNPVEALFDVGDVRVTDDDGRSVVIRSIPRPGLLYARLTTVADAGDHHAEGSIPSLSGVGNGPVAAVLAVLRDVEYRVTADRIEERVTGVGADYRRSVRAGR